MNIQSTFYFLLLSFVLSLSACGGGSGSNNTAGTGGGGGGGGIGGTGITARGAIDGFGSIFVNGIEFDTDNAEITIDGVASTDTSLGLGMIVLVNGTVNADGLTGTATSVIFDDDVQGPVLDLATSSDGQQLTFTVLGINVIADATSTIFDDVTSSTLANNDLVEVSGLFNGLGDLIASRIEKKENFTPNVSEVELKGFVSNTNANSFSLGDFTVVFDGTTDVSDLTGGVVSDGIQVEVKGTLNASTITASRIEDEDDLISNSNNSGTNVSVDGVISSFVSNSDFELSGIPVNASNAVLIPSNLVLVDNLSVEVEGTITNGVLIATEVKLDQGEIDIAAFVDSVDLNDRTITMSILSGQTLTINVDNGSQLEDETNVEEILTLDEINTGDYLEIRAYQETDDQLVADQIRRDDADDTEITAAIDAIDPNISITLLGITFSIDGSTSFRNASDQSISSSEFYNSVSVGMSVKVQDDFPSDGVADEVEIED